MKTLKELLDEIVEKNIKLPAPIFFSYMPDGPIHSGHISSMYSESKMVVLNYLDTKKNCRHKLFLTVTQNSMRAELDIDESPVKKKELEG